jgi:hypothetical protein
MAANSIGSQIVVLYRVSGSYASCLSSALLFNICDEKQKEFATAL